ncbi:MAG: hypothetical protein ACKV2T_38390 [Kofleriaceae bacterium]
MSIAVPIKPSPTPPTDLQTRVEDRKRELISEIIEHKKNSSRAGAVEAIARAKARLSELAHIVKEGVVDGWVNVGPSAKLRLDDWMAR